jgi:NADPH-dependent stearoyl-CoA 9-desaturase
VHTFGQSLLVADDPNRIGLRDTPAAPTYSTTALTMAKSIENTELGHNISHGQWDWMNDPETHSSAWEWDMAGVSSQWRYSHNYRHHMFTNVIGVNNDLGFGVRRVTRDQKPQRSNLFQPLRNILLAIMFEVGHRGARLAFGA